MLEDGAVSALPGPEERQDHVAAGWRERIFVLLTQMSHWGAAAALPALGRCDQERCGRHLFCWSSPGLTFPSHAALADPCSSACCPGTAPSSPWPSCPCLEAL